jgi:predicted nucleic acid-binding protein
MKLVFSERESPALRSFLRGAAVVSSELLLTEAGRAARRAVAGRRELAPIDVLLERMARQLDAMALVPVDGGILVHAGSLDGAGLRSLDAIHVASAKAVRPIEAFVTYDARQATAAEHAGLRTAAPGT